MSFSYFLRLTKSAASIKEYLKTFGDVELKAENKKCCMATPLFQFLDVSKSYSIAKWECFESVSKQKGHLAFLKWYPIFISNFFFLLFFLLWNYLPTHLCCVLFFLLFFFSSTLPSYFMYCAQHLKNTVKINLHQHSCRTALCFNKSLGFSLDSEIQTCMYCRKTCQISLAKTNTVANLSFKF